jgi:hypothetical protein
VVVGSTPAYASRFLWPVLSRPWQAYYQWAVLKATVALVVRMHYCAFSMARSGICNISTLRITQSKPKPSQKKENPHEPYMALRAAYIRAAGNPVLLLLLHCRKCSKGGGLQPSCPRNGMEGSSMARYKARGAPDPAQPQRCRHSPCGSVKLSRRPPFMGPPGSPFPEKCNITLHGMATWCAPRQQRLAASLRTECAAVRDSGAATPESLSARHALLVYVDC